MDQLTPPVKDRKDIRIEALRQALEQICDRCDDCSYNVAAKALDSDDLMKAWDRSL